MPRYVDTRGDQRPVSSDPPDAVDKAVVFRVVDEDLGGACPAKPHRVLGDRLEDRLESKPGRPIAWITWFVAACCSSKAECSSERAPVSGSVDSSAHD